MTRRQSIKNISAFASGLIINHWAFALPARQSVQKQLIREIQLETPVEPSSLRQFYCGKLGFDLVHEGRDRCSFKTGSSVLTFSRTKTSKRPHYHFAFNISSQKIREAEQWLKAQEVAIVTPPIRLTQRPEYSEDIVYFSHWDAHAIFFYDPAGNIVEFIARHTLGDSREGDFSLKDVHYISEIGLVTDNVSALSRDISISLNLSPYSRQSDRFAALGSEAGLILCFQTGRGAVFGTGRKRAVYPTGIHLADGYEGLSFTNSHFNIS